MIRIGSLFSGIGGFELGVERAIPNAKTVWQVEENTYCQTILKKHWPDAQIYDDIRTVTADELESVEILLGGFPCQDLSIAGKQKGVYDGKKSSLWWEMHRVIGIVRPRVVIMENVANIVRVGGTTVVASLTKIGYDCEWTVIRSGADFGAPHLRRRWFCVAYPAGIRCGTSSYPEREHQHRIYKQWNTTQSEQQRSKRQLGIGSHGDVATNAHGIRPTKTQHGRVTQAFSKRTKIQCGRPSGNKSNQTYWQQTPSPQPTVCSMDDGVSTRLARLKALGNSIVPQASEWVAQQVLNSGLINDLL